jgi:hypothetical protein
MIRACSKNGENKNAYRILVAKPEGKRPLGKPRRKWVNNIKMDLRETVCDCIDWLYLAQDTEKWRVLVKTTMDFRVP